MTRHPKQLCLFLGIIISVLLGLFVYFWVEAKTIVCYDPLNTEKIVPPKDTIGNDTIICSCPEYLILNLQPLDGFSLKELNQLESDLQEHLFPIYPVTLQIWETDKKVPQSSLYTPRNRYRADSLLRFLHIEGADFVTMGVISKDISTTIHGAKDYGIMGLSTCPGYTSVISSYRLKNKRNLWKLAIHEFLHTRGLPHCENDGCFMKDRHGKNAIESSHYLCGSCRKRIQKSTK